MEKLNVGFIGCGRISDLHFPGYRNNPAGRIYAVCDSDPERAERKKSEWKAEKAFTDYREMLQDPNLDAVEILTPQACHEVMVREAASCGKHIALQKPMTIDLKSADRILKAVKDAGVVFRVTDNYLFYPPIVLAKTMIAAGEVGTPTNLRIKMISGGTGGWDIPTSAWEWRMFEKEAGRGLQTFDHGHHLWAAAWFLLGDIERVSGWIDSLDGIVDSPSVIMWKYRDAVRYGMCEYAHGADLNIPSKYYANDEWMEITGTKGIIMIHRCTGDINPGPGVSLFKGDDWQHYADVETDWVSGFVGATRNFISAVRGDADPLLSGEEGREILKINLAISKSARVRREVYVDEMDAPFPWLYTRKKVKKEIKRHSSREGLLALIGLGNRDAGYAGRAVALTQDLVDRFDPEAVGAWQAEIGLHLMADGGAPESRFSLSIKNGKVFLTDGRLPDDAVMTLKVPAGTWAAILLGKKKIETAFIQRKLKITGRAEHGLKLREAFKI
jgi:predicted dehydrogenase